MTNGLETWKWMDPVAPYSPLVAIQPSSDTSVSNTSNLRGRLDVRERHHSPPRNSPNLAASSGESLGRFHGSSRASATESMGGEADHRRHREGLDGGGRIEAVERQHGVAGAMSTPSLTDLKVKVRRIVAVGSANRANAVAAGDRRPPRRRCGEGARTSCAGRDHPARGGRPRRSSPTPPTARRRKARCHRHWRRRIAEVGVIPPMPFRSSPT